MKIHCKLDDTVKVDTHAEEQKAQAGEPNKEQLRYYRLSDALYAQLIPEVLQKYKELGPHNFDTYDLGDQAELTFKPLMTVKTDGEY